MDGMARNTNQPIGLALSRRRLLSALPLGALALAACAPIPPATPTPARPAAAPTTAPTPEKATLILDWFINTNHAGIYLAQQRGWYAAEGLDLKIEQLADPSASMKLVGAGTAELGISYQSSVSIARAQDVPVVSIAALVQHLLGAYASKKSKNIARPKDIEGKKFGTSGLAFVEPTLRATLACDKADIGKVEMVNVGQKLSPALLSDQVDVVAMLPTWEGLELELKGNELAYIHQKDWCVPDVYNIAFISSESTIRQRPDVIRRFLKPTARGYELAAKSPAEAVEAVMKAAPELDRKLVEASQQRLSAHFVADAPRWGVQTPERWRTYADWLVQNKLIEKPIDSTKAFTNDFLPFSCC